ncbi:MAG: fumarylacetoacetate hydrolase family protein [Candidatus Marinimicrobia bacterium]|jgi:2-keto-4-pentenoate hydratase/2-oxohepta-3-ene-1,7-dioic acid hydratase in catechol pathway|nr:2-keto-4-pentenoate hydratase [Candidatus Neomarinimicrobiota bacterium]MDP6593000.1 fumarylacetoacetate hydrolase family protein [Candidatus Neomarinimicrobiota bacterium]MDP6835711.1 fumarylacetoacetate hydrolase family protein [Candidatus Neomarinimicrobiota bacterium]MDP6965813.1 fumarylacetoacetate hydrolase family protein [Candidatus Neomarinimicrobiota bacterium]|tara:strand:- start:907 stop:1518 length:612 start_codon:yes stop_codon:yes gene_type:complete
MNNVTFDSHQIVPSKIVCVGMNYVEHVRELESQMPSEPVIFLKPNSAISDNIRSADDDRFHFEAEISFIVQDENLAGVGIGFDLTKRSLQSKLKSRGLPWEKSKAFDGAAVFSDFVVIESPLSTLSMELLINGTVVQRGGVELMIYKPEELLHEAKSFLSLEDGDILMTGTPEGVGEFIKDDQFTGRILCEDDLLVEQIWIAE